MKAFGSLVLFVLCCTFVAVRPVHGQNATPTPAVPDGDSDVVKITTKLVQLDFLVVDKDGKQVRNLTVDDFEVLEDGKPQKITGFSYVNTSPAASAPKDTTREKESQYVPPPKVLPSNAGRILTFIVDDGNCAVSTTGIRASREGVEKFIREQMMDNDLVAIYQTRSGSSVFQQYTNDKALLLKIARKIQWYPPGGSCSSSDGSLFAAAESNTFIKRSAAGTTTKTIESEAEGKLREGNEDLANNSAVVGALGVVRYVVQGLQRVPGRKTVFLLSDGLPMHDRHGYPLSSLDVLRDLTELANRASVVFTTIDSRGLFDSRMIEARDEVYAQDDISATDRVGDKRAADSRNSQNGLFFLANETGGSFHKGLNFLDVPIRKALSLETGYYLLGYEPDDNTFKDKKFNKVTVKLRTPGLRVVSRSGFLGMVAEEAKPKRRTEYSDLYGAIVTPLPIPGLDLRLTAHFGNSQSTGNFVRSYFHLSGNEIKFVEVPGGDKKAVIDVVAVTLNEKNEVIDEFTRTHTLKVPAAAAETIIKNGLAYSTDIPVAKPGTYNFRVAVRDVSSQLLGSAGQVVEIPDLKKQRLHVAGLAITGADANGKFLMPGPTTSETAFALVQSSGTAAVRRFRRGSRLAYAYTIYNARLDKTSGQPSLSVQMNLFKDGKMILEGAAKDAAFGLQSDLSRIKATSFLGLTPQTDLGGYTLQLVIKDLLADGKSATSSQWIDFEVID